jgi:acyl-CoA thioesterase FadM
MYLAQEGVLAHLRAYDVGPQRMFDEFQLQWNVVDCSMAFLALVQSDDNVEVEVTHSGGGRFAVHLFRCDDNGNVSVARGHIVAGYELPGRQSDVPGALPSNARRFVAPAARKPDGARGDPSGLSTPKFDSALWSWAARYFLCNYSTRLQHSAYIRALEETVDRYLASRGLTIGHVLAGRSWIPVVSRVRVRVLSDVLMEETVATTFTVDEVFKTAGYNGRMDCYVERSRGPVHVATASIVHGYAHVGGAEPGRRVDMDDATIASLAGARA